MGKQLDHTSHDVKGKFSLSILAHQLKSPYNLGVIFRLADALGVKKLYLSGDTILPPNRKISKTSRSTEKSVYYEQVDNIQEFIQNLKNDGVLIVALELCDNSIPIEEIILPDNAEVCLILGEENYGVNPELLSAADMIGHIPMQGHNSSMNVASACAIAAYSLINKLKK